MTISRSLLGVAAAAITALSPTPAAAQATRVIEVDGGIDPETAALAVSAGATALVAGTAVFRGGADQYAANISALRGA